MNFSQSQKIWSRLIATCSTHFERRQFYATNRLLQQIIVALKKALDYPKPEESFYVPAEVYAHINELTAASAKAETDWNKLLADYAEKFPADKKLFDQYFAPIDAEKLLADKNFWAREEKPQATRATSGTMIRACW